MIYHISGKLDAVLEDAIIVDVSGIGYHVFVPESILNRLPEKGAEIKVFTYHHIREDAQSLFGFLSEEDRSLFILLIASANVGAKVITLIFSQSSASFESGMVSVTTN